MSGIEWITLLPDDRNPTEGVFKTDRYNVSFKEFREGGPGGYESKYLVSEGCPASEEIYNELNKLSGKFLPIENRSIRLRNVDAFLYALSNEKNLGIASGFKPSGPYHFGHKLTSGAVTFFQKNGMQVFVPVADIEARLDKKEEVRKNYMYWAADNLLDWGANGMNLDTAHVYLQSEENRVNDLAYSVAREATLDMPLDIYGLKKMVEDFPFFFAGMTQVGDILLPQHPDFGNYHSFMVSGPDQDGHMKMTILLADYALRNGTPVPGLTTVPSGFYIPHIRGFKRQNQEEEPKMSSSFEKGTLYLGSGPHKQDIERRIKTSLKKFDPVHLDTISRDDIKYCALDMVRFIDFFNQRSKVDFSDTCQSKKFGELIQRFETEMDGMKKVVQREMDNYLIKACEDVRQDNVELVRDSLKEMLLDHWRKRMIVLQYAIDRATYRDPGAWDTETEKPRPPDFWRVSEKSIVDSSKRNETEWYNIIYENRELLLP